MEGLATERGFKVNRQTFADYVRQAKAAQVNGTTRALSQAITSDVFDAIQSAGGCYPHLRPVAVSYPAEGLYDWSDCVYAGYDGRGNRITPPFADSFHAVLWLLLRTQDFDPQELRWSDAMVGAADLGRGALMVGQRALDAAQADTDSKLRSGIRSGVAFAGQADLVTSEHTKHRW